MAEREIAVQRVAASPCWEGGGRFDAPQAQWAKRLSGSGLRRETAMLAAVQEVIELPGHRDGVPLTRSALSQQYHTVLSRSARANHEVTKG